VIGAGGIAHEPAHLVDLVATCLDAAGAPYPAERNGRAVTPLEGESFLRRLRGGTWRREWPIFFEHEGNRAVRDGRWKLVAPHRGPWELYDMQADRTELADLAAKDKPRVERLSAEYDRWAQRCGVMDYDELCRRNR
jgi:arylsulfatase